MSVMEQDEEGVVGLRVLRIADRVAVSVDDDDAARIRAEAGHEEQIIDLEGTARLEETVDDGLPLFVLDEVCPASLVEILGSCASDLDALGSWKVGDSKERPRAAVPVAQGLTNRDSHVVSTLEDDEEVNRFDELGARRAAAE